MVTCGSVVWISKRRNPSNIAPLLACDRVYPGSGMASLQIKTADELGAADLEQGWKSRRAGRETVVARRVLQIFVDRGGPIPIEQVIAALPDGPAEETRRALVRLDDD